MAPIDLFFPLSRMKDKKRLNNRLIFILSVALSICVFFILLPLLRLDYDGHHDGVMLASAIANRDGHAVHSEVFAQYGPISVWIHSFFLIFNTPPAITLRVVTGITIAMTFFFIADLGRFTRKALGLTSSVTISAALAWIIVSDAFNWVTLLPWSSTLAQLLIVVGLYLVLGANGASTQVRGLSFRNQAIWGGLIWSLLPFTRVNVGVALLPALVLIWAISEIKISNARHSLRSIMLGICLGLISVVLILIFTNSFTQWWSQAVVWPSQWNASLNTGTGMFLKLKFMYSNMFSQMVWGFLLLAILFVFNKSSFRWKFFLQTCVISIFTVFAVKYFSSSAPQIWSAAPLPQSLQSIANMRVSLLGFLFWSGLSVSVLTGLSILFAIYWKESDDEGIMLLLFIAVSISGTVQIVPVSDSRHFWWGMPLVILVLFRQVSKLLNHSLVSSLILFTPLIFASVFAISLTKENLAQPRRAAPIGSVAQGMMLKTSLNDGVSQSTRYLQNFTALSRWIGSDQSIIFLVRDGDLSVFDTTYHSIDENFVIWGPVMDFESRVVNATGVVLDLDYVSAFQPVLLDLGFSQVATTEAISIWKR